MAKQVKLRQSIQLEDELWRGVDAYGKSHNLSRSAVLADGVRLLLKEREADAEAKANRIITLGSFPDSRKAWSVIRDIILDRAKGG
jgi:metal-responsive CopG/Arc/MetJ family transcriptional regulator